MSRTPLIRTAGVATDRRLDGADPDPERERLLHVARQAGLEPGDVVRLTEALTGRTWDQCGPTEIGVVARALLKAAGRAVSGQPDGAPPCAR